MGAPGHLVQILVPVADNAGRRFPDRIWEELKSDLANRFGGVTAYRRAPAEGVWKNRREGRTDDEDLFVVEVMTDTLDETYWEKLQEDLEQQLDQERIVIRDPVCRDKPQAPRLTPDARRAWCWKPIRVSRV